MSACADIARLLSPHSIKSSASVPGQADRLEVGWEVGHVRRFGSKADIARDQLNVRCTPKSRHWRCARQGCVGMQPIRKSRRTSLFKIHSAPGRPKNTVWTQWRITF